MPKNKTILIILDGWGLNKKYPGNAIELANKPFYDKLWKDYPAAVLETSGESVGLPEGQMGTSEVNHFTIGAGKVIFQDLVRINKSINDGSFHKKAAFLNAFKYAKDNNSTLHLIGLLSTGGVHSHSEHFFALLEAAKKQKVEKVLIHVITDGRDTSPNSADEFVQQLEDKITEIGLGRIASVGGRYYAMDRDKNWDRTDLYFNAITKGQAPEFSTAQNAIQASYNQKVSDEYIKPVIIEAPTGETNVVQDNDAVIFVNFRNDRPRQIVERFLKKGPKKLHISTMTQYHPLYQVDIAFKLEEINMTLGKVISDNDIKQLRVTETEKFAHVTFFANCKREDAYEGEDRVMFDSYSDIPTHDYKPEMRAMDIAEEIVKDIEGDKHDFIFANICNADMVGHTGNIPAAVKACETVDKALKKIVPEVLKHDCNLIITADHGNADEMLNEETGDMITCHSTNPVPLIIVSNKYKKIKRKSGTLIDLAPTILTMLGLDIPIEMTGESFV